MSLYTSQPVALKLSVTAVSGKGSLRWGGLGNRTQGMRGGTRASKQSDFTAQVWSRTRGGPPYGALHFSAGAVELSGGRWEVTVDLLLGMPASSRWNASGCICSRWTVVSCALQDWQRRPACASHGRAALWTLTVSLLPAPLTLTSCMSPGTFSVSVQIGHGHLNLTLSFTHTVRHALLMLEQRSDGQGWKGIKARWGEWQIHYEKSSWYQQAPMLVHTGECWFWWSPVKC